MKPWAILSGLVPFLWGCARSPIPSVYPHPERPGQFLVYYDWNLVLNEDGPGKEAMMELLRNVSAPEAEQLWEETMAAAVARNLVRTNKVPEACGEGVLVLSSNKDEGGNGLSLVKCK